MLALVLSPGARVVVVDDDRQEAETAARPLIDYGFVTDTISTFDPAQDADAFLASLTGAYDALVADHVLSGHSPVGFTGAELVSKANRLDVPLPAILISSHIRTDETGNIRRWREGIPRVVDKSDLSDEVIEALDFTVSELRGEIARERRPFTTPIEIVDVHDSGEAPSAKVVVVGWRIATYVWMPLDLISTATGLTPAALRGIWLEAEVNCYAESEEDLYFRNITLAPDIPVDWREHA